MKKESLLRSVLADIIKGYSLYHPEKIYIKHLCLNDYVDYERIYNSHYERLIKKGVDTDEKLLKRAIAQELWSKEEDLQLEELRENIKQLNETIKRTSDSLMRKSAQNNLNEIEAERYLLLAKKNSITQSSCERLTEEKMNEHYILNSLFKDSEFKRPLLSEEEKDDVDTDINKLIRIYNQTLQNISDKNIKYLSIQGFFTSGWNLCKNPYEYFGKPICSITYNQTNLASYAKYFSNIFEAFPNIDSDDPDEIIYFAKLRQEADKEEGKRDYVNLSHEDAKRAGIKMKDRSAQFNKMGK